MTDETKTVLVITVSKDELDSFLEKINTISDVTTLQAFEPLDVRKEEILRNLEGIDFKRFL